MTPVARFAIGRGKPGQVLKHVSGLGPLATTALHLDVHLWIFAPDAEAVMTPDQAQMALAVASLIVGDANALPPANRRRLERLTRALRRALEDTRPPAARLDVTAADRAVWTSCTSKRLFERACRCVNCTGVATARTSAS